MIMGERVDGGGSAYRGCCICPSLVVRYLDTVAAFTQQTAPKEKNVDNNRKEGYQLTQSVLRDSSRSTSPHRCEWS